MKNEKFFADIESKSLKEAKEEINKILTKLESQETDLMASSRDYDRLLKLNKHVDMLFKKKLKKIRK